MRKSQRRLDPLQSPVFQLQRLKERRETAHRMNCGTDVMPEPGEGQFGSARPSTDRFFFFQHANGQAGTRKCNGSAETVRPRAYNDCIKLMCAHFTTTISTLRFRARPCGVALSATGFDLPYPFDESRPACVPCFTSQSTTAAARFCDNCRLYSSALRASVWPSTSTRTAVSFLSASATCCKVDSDSAFKTAESESNWIP